MLLLKITTTPIEYTLQVEKASLKPLEDVNKTEATAPAAPDFSRQATERRRSDGAIVTGVRADKDNENAYRAYVKTNGAPRAAAPKPAAPVTPQTASSLDENADRIPTAFSASWEPVTIDVKPAVEAEQPDTAVAEQAQLQPRLEFVPGSMKLKIEQLAKVDCEYVGGMRYVPASSAPDYEPPSD